MTTPPFIIAAARVIDGVGSLAEVDAASDELRRRGARTIELTIDPLAAGWTTPLASNHFRSGCAPIAALAHANELIRTGAADAVLIRGEDRIRSDYAADKPSRERLMNIYGPACSIPHAYTLLARAFMRLHDLDDDRFRALARALFDNYVRTASKRGSPPAIKPAAFQMATDLFRLVDCANPVVDFAGAVLLANESLAPAANRVALAAVALGETPGDGPAAAETIATYEHLAHACRAAKREVDFAAAFLAGEALLEAYTCFPVAPLGFLLASGIAKRVDEIDAVLAAREVTVTGGMNLARAPWNNPALNAAIALVERLRAGDAPLAAVHGNGGLGYKQGVAVLRVAN